VLGLEGFDVLLDGVVVVVAVLVSFSAACAAACEHWEEEGRGKEDDAVCGEAISVHAPVTVRETLWSPLLHSHFHWWGCADGGHGRDGDGGASWRGGMTM